MQCVVVEQAQQVNEQRARDCFREQVGKHDRAAHMRKRDDFTPHQIAKELGGAHDVLSILE